MPRAFTEIEQHTIRARLLQAGREALPKTGLRRTSVEDLTRAAGISKGAFYRFFDTKEDLWIALLLEGEAYARATLKAQVDDPRPGALLRVLDAMFRSTWDRPALLALADAEDLAWLTRSLPVDRLAEARRDDDRFFAELLRELQRRGEVRDDVDPTAFAGLPGAAMALAQHRSTIGNDRVDAVIGLLVDGLVARLAPAG